MTKAIIVRDGRAVEFLVKARQAVEKASSVQELKGIRDQAEAIRIYAKQAGESLAVQNACAEIKIRAECKAGELIEGLALRPGKKKANSDTMSLKGLGLEPQQSSRWQRQASVPPPTREKWIKETKEKGEELTSSGLRKLAAAQKKKETRDQLRSAVGSSEGKIEKLSDGFGKYRCLYLDPPWAYRDSKVHGGVGHEYDTMTLEQLEDTGDDAFPLPKLLTEEGGHVWMWTTWPMIREGAPLRLFKAWGLEWVGEVVWDKDKLLLGRWLRVQTEILCLGVVGKVPRLAEDVRGLVREKSGKHSAKPDSFYGLIEKFSPGPRLELFARKARDGWDRWGKEA